MLSACSYLSDEQLHGLVPSPIPCRSVPNSSTPTGTGSRTSIRNAAASDHDRGHGTHVPSRARATRSPRRTSDSRRSSPCSRRRQSRSSETASNSPIPSPAPPPSSTRRPATRSRPGEPSRTPTHGRDTSRGPRSKRRCPPTQRDDDVAIDVPPRLPACARTRRRRRRGTLRGAGRPLRAGPRTRGAPPDPRASLLHAAGRPDRAMECLRRVTPVNSSASIVGHATYRAGRIAFATDASPHSPAQMAAGAEAATADSPTDAVVMWADAAASAALMDLMDDAVRYARQAIQVAGSEPSASRDLAIVTAQLVRHAPHAPRRHVAGRPRQPGALLNAPSPFVGSPQLAYVIGSAVVRERAVRPRAPLVRLHERPAASAESGAPRALRSRWSARRRCSRRAASPMRWLPPKRRWPVSRAARLAAACPCPGWYAWAQAVAGRGDPGLSVGVPLLRPRAGHDPFCPSPGAGCARPLRIAEGPWRSRPGLARIRWKTRPSPATESSHTSTGRCSPPSCNWRVADRELPAQVASMAAGTLRQRGSRPLHGMDRRPVRIRSGGVAPPLDLALLARTLRMTRSSRRR